MLQKIKAHYSWKRAFYAICFLTFCVIDQRSKTMSYKYDGIYETFRDAMGIVLAGIVLSHYKAEEFKKWKLPHLVWGILSVIGGIGAFLWGLYHYPFLNQWIVIILNIILWGFIVIHTFIHVLIEKNYPRLNRKFLAVWGTMMFLMIVSRSHYIWPLCYAVMFGCFYLTDYSKEEWNDLWQGGLDGIILGFIVFQAYCCVFRPYDSVRYVGIYNNSNLNGLFYLAVLAAVFTKIIYFTKQNAGKWLKIFYWLAAGVVISFLFMTIGRIAWITAFVMSVLFLAFLDIILQKKQWVKNGLALLLCIVLTFPICFGATRYIPPLFHHPVWFWGEWSEKKVHSWDPWDSEKYVEMDELLDAALGRILYSITNLLEHSPFLARVNAAEEEEGEEAETPVLAPNQETDDFLVRSNIYKYYFTHLNWRGHPYDEQDFQLTKLDRISHAHNIYLQYGTDFGIPVLLLFLYLIIWSCRICWKRARDHSSVINTASLFFILIPAVFGLLEYSWGISSLSITMLFFSWKQTVET